MRGGEQSRWVQDCPTRSRTLHLSHRLLPTFPVSALIGTCRSSCRRDRMPSRLGSLT